MVSVSNSTGLIDNQGHAGGLLSPEQTPLDVIQKPESSNLTLQAPSHRLSSFKNQQALPPLGLTCSPRFVSPLSYETVRNIQPSNSYPIPSSAGATNGANSSSEARTRRDDSASHLMPMSTQNDKSDGVQQPEPAHTSPLSPSASARPPQSVLYQRSFQRQPFPGQQYYSGHSAQPVEPAYAPPAPYGQHSGPGPGYMGQWGSQPSLPITMQSPVQFGYSHSFTHPGIHAQDTSSLGMPFNQHHHGHSYGYPHPLGPTVDAGAGDRTSRSTEGYAGPSSSYPEAAGAPQQAGSAPPTASHMSHHAYSPVHYSQPSASPHYAGYSPHSFAHSSPGLYPFAPAPPTYPQTFYGQPPPASPETPSKGTAYWYLPPGGTQQYDTSAYQPGYAMQGYQSSMQMNRQEFDPYTSQAQAGPNSPPPFAVQSNQPMRLPSGAAHNRGQPSQSISPIHARARSDAPHADAVSPISKKRSPHDTVSTSPPAASRKSYHPNPPPNRSEWVMWVGNVPSEATHDELWRFFNQPAPAPAPQPGTSAMLSLRQVRPAGNNDTDSVWGGVASVFLISRSNCAFVNFETEKHLACAVLHFNGKPIRPRDPRCPRLVCRVRKKDDDLRAGVGGQRGMGLHTRWVLEQKERGRERELRARQKGGNESEGEGGEGTESSGDGPPTSPSTYLEPSSSSDPSPPILAVSPNDELGPVHISGSEPRHGSSGNQSFTSTNSSFLANNFPKRYFILKSLTQYDLNLSLDRGIWATQPHNEGILDQAYRTSSDVYLIFGANKSGEFFGYARMAGPILHNERVDPVSWASRSSGSASGARGGTEVIKEEDEPGNDSNTFLPPAEHRLVDESPAPVTADEDARLHQVGVSKDVDTSKPEDPATAPPELHQAHKRMSVSHLLRNAETLPERHRDFPPEDGFPKTVSEGFLLTAPPPRDPAKVQARRDHMAKTSTLDADSDGVRRKDTFVTAHRHQRGKDAAQAVNAAGAAAAARLPTGLRLEEQMQGGNLSGEDKPEGWGREFKIEWLRTERLPFHRTRHLRNPWNHDREVKVSRDGTELEPTAGQKLLDEWDKPVAEVEASPPTSPTARGRGSKATFRATGATGGTSMPPGLPSLSPQVQRASSSGAMGQVRRGPP